MECNTEVVFDVGSLYTRLQEMKDTCKGGGQNQ